MEINTEDCKECNGRGYVFKKERTIYRCKSCCGFGEIDWVKKVTRSFDPREVPFMTTLVKRWEKETGYGFFIMSTGNDWAFGEPYENQY